MTQAPGAGSNADGRGDPDRRSYADAWLARLYAGDIFSLEASDAAARLAADAWALVGETFADIDDPRLAHDQLGNEEMFARVKVLRREFYCADEWREKMAAVCEARGFDPNRLAFDPLRLRLVASDGHAVPAAAPLYGIHRDVWYAHPPCLVTWWLPLHPAGPDDTFVFYPDAFGQPVPNDSEIFDYAEWVKDGPDLKIGWQDIRDGSRAPFPAFDEARAAAAPDVARRLERREPVEFKGLGELIFSGAHLHGTLRQSTGLTRFSLDFRMVDERDVAAGRGAPVPDNRSRGSAAPDYFRP